MLDNTYSIYEKDKQLFKKLGLKEFHKITNWETFECGEIVTDYYNIKISVMGCSAQFFTAEIIRKEGNQKLKVTTGSGCLSNFWNSIELIAEGMIGIETFE